MAVDAKTCRECALQCAIMALIIEAPKHRRLFTRLFNTFTKLAIDFERNTPRIKTLLPKLGGS